MCHVNENSVVEIESQIQAGIHPLAEGIAQNSKFSLTLSPQPEQGAQMQTDIQSSDCHDDESFAPRFGKNALYFTANLLNTAKGLEFCLGVRSKRFYRSSKTPL